MTVLVINKRVTLNTLFPAVAYNIAEKCTGIKKEKKSSLFPESCLL